MPYVASAGFKLLVMVLKRTFLSCFISALCCMSVCSFATERTDSVSAVGNIRLSSDSLSLHTDSATYQPDEFLPLSDILHVRKDTVASVSDSLRREAKKAKKKNKNFKFSILGGPGYTPDYGFLIGGAALFSFSADKRDTALQRSVIPVNFGLTFSKPLGFYILVKPQIFFKKDRIRLFGIYEYENNNDNYYGVGYDDNHNTQRGKYITGFRQNTIHLNPVLMFRLRESRCFLGASVDYIYEKITSPGEFVLNDPVYVSQGGTADGFKANNLGLGAVFSYDTRDMAANPYNGVFFELKLSYYSKYFGGDFNYGSFNMDYRQYYKLSKSHRRVLAWNVLVKSTFQDVPFTQYAIIGGPYDLRGYYQGQYRDKSTAVAMLEYRQMWDAGSETKIKRLLSRLGYVLWGGCGIAGPSPVCYNAVLPNLGLGLRVEVQPRMNFRVDGGYSFADKHMLFYFNMTEAF